MAEPLQYKTLQQYVQLQLDYIVSNSPTVLSRPLGPFVTALAYAVGFVAVTLQRLIQLVLLAARLSTATGSDVDSFVADFGLTREQGVAATGQVTLARFVTAASTISIPIGATVATSTTPTVQFQVIADSTNSNFNVSLNAYQLLSGNISVTATVQCTQAGIVGNVGIGTINTIVGSLPGIDTVTNANTFVNGVNVETDVQLQQRFALYLAGLSKATSAAIASAIENLPEGPSLQYVIIDPASQTPPTTPGTFTVVVDDGSGNPPTPTVNDAANAVAQVRPIGVRAIVRAPSAINLVFVSAAVRFKAALTPNVAALQTVIRNALLTYINTLTIGSGPDFAYIYKTIWEAASPGDSVSTTVAISPASTTSVIQVASTMGMVAQQVVQISGSSPTSGVIPLIRSVDSDTQITISPPLSTIPVPGATVTAFSTNQSQIVDFESVNIGLLDQTSPSTPLLTTDNTSTSTLIKVTSTNGVANTHFVVVAGFQTNPTGGGANGGPPTVLSFISNTSITLSEAIGSINAVTGTWTPVGTSGVVIPAGTMVGTSVGGTTDLQTLSSTTAVARSFAGLLEIGMVQG